METFALALALATPVARPFSIPSLALALAHTLALALALALTLALSPTSRTRCSSDKPASAKAHTAVDESSSAGAFVREESKFRSSIGSGGYTAGMHSSTLHSSLTQHSLHSLISFHPSAHS
jgi:hypothetical protein